MLWKSLKVITVKAAPNGNSGDSGDGTSTLDNDSSSSRSGGCGVGSSRSGSHIDSTGDHGSNVSGNCSRAGCSRAGSDGK